MNSQPIPSPTHWWDDHGTKILGTLTTILGVASASLPTLQPIMSQPIYLITQFFLGIVVAAFGAGTVKRGFTNTASNS